MTDTTSKQISRPALTRRPVDPAALKQFADAAGKTEVVLPGASDELPTTSEKTHDSAPLPVTTAPAALPIQPAGKPSHIPYIEKVKPSLFRMTGPQAILLDAVFNRTRYKSKQALYEGEFVTRLRNMAEEFAKTDPEMAAILESLRDEQSLFPERRS